MDSDPNIKNDLLDLICKYGNQGEEIAKKGIVYQKYGQYVSDLSKESLEVVKNLTKYGIPSNVSLNTMYHEFEYGAGDNEAFLLKLPDCVPTASTAIANTFLSILPSPENPELNSSVVHFANIVDRQDYKSQLTQLMKQYHLDIPTKGQKSALELFETAWKSFETPVDPNSPSSTCLLPMRSAMDVTLDTLIKRRPIQEPAKHDKGKVLSLLSQMSKPNIPQTITDNLADKWHNMRDWLSKGKTNNINRDSCRDLLRRSTLILLELLQMIDPTKIRSSD